jgi:hypothetical protein
LPVLCFFTQENVLPSKGPWFLKLSTEILNSEKFMECISHNLVAQFTGTGGAVCKGATPSVEQ